MTDDEFLVLNSVYLRKLASSRAVADCTRLAPTAIEPILSAAQEAGQILDVGDGTCMLSDEGTRAVLEGYAERYGTQRAEGSLEGWYHRFESLNTQFLSAVTTWQKGGAEDSSKLDRLLRIVEHQIRALETATEQVPRYEIYRFRFERALDRVDQGQVDHIVSPQVDSIHNIWFEFHEDILTLLGRPRDVAEAHG